MRTFFTFLLILLVFSMAVGPYADGYLMKRIFMNDIAEMQALMQSQHSNAEIVIESYDLGWFASTATLSVNDKNNDKKTILLNLVLHHGPVVFVNGQPTIALAYIEGDAQYPELSLLKLKLSSLVPIDQHINVIQFDIAPIQFGKAISWDGLKGNTAITKNGNAIAEIKTHMTIGKISAERTDMTMGAMHLEIGQSSAEMDYKKSNTDDFISTYLYQMGSMRVSSAMGDLVTIKSGAVNGATNVKDSLLNTKTDMTLSTIKLNAEMSGNFSNISDLNYNFSIDNLNQTNLISFNAELNKQKNAGSRDYQALSDSLLSVLTSKTALSTNLSIKTSDGTSSVDMQLTLSGIPKTTNDLQAMINGKLDVRVTKPLLNEIVKLVLSIYQTAQLIANPGMSQAAEISVSGTASFNGGESEIMAQGQPAAPVDSHAYYQGIADLVKTGDISPDQSVILMSLPDKKLDRNALDTAIDAMGLSAGAKASVVALYVKNYIPESTAPAEIATPSQPDVGTKSSLTDPDAVIKNLIEQGVIKDEGNMYTVVIEKTGQEIKVNGNADIQKFTQGLLSASPAIAESASVNDEVNDTLSKIQAIRASIDALSNNEYTNANVTVDNVKSLMPNGSLDTPWGTTISFSIINATSYKVVLPATPEEVCKQLSARLVPHPTFTEVTPIVTCAATGTDFTYVYDSTK